MHDSVTFYYDGDCGICSTLARWAARNTSATMRTVQESEAELVALGAPPDGLLAMARANAGGRLVSGAKAIAAVLAAADRPSPRGLGRLMMIPVVAPLAERAYRWVAANRALLSRFFY
jgi:predicted DCC family thiol-disulfide oxidoreductase YuxK